MEETKPFICEDSEDNKSCASPGRSPSDQTEEIDRTKQQLENIKSHLPEKSEFDAAMKSLDLIRDELAGKVELSQLQRIMDKVRKSMEVVDTQLASKEFTRRPVELQKELEIGEHIKSILETIPGIAESQLRPYVRTEARQIFLEIFNDRYGDLSIDDNYDISLYDLQGNRVPLKAASGGEDVCVNFASVS